MATMEAIRSIRIESNQNTQFSWTSLPTTYESFRLYCSWNSERFTSTDVMKIRAGNGSVSSSNIYGLQELRSIWVSGSSSTNSIGTDYGHNGFSHQYGTTGLSGYSANSCAVVDIFGVSDTDVYSSMTSQYGCNGQYAMRLNSVDPSGASTDSNCIYQGGLYRDTVAIDSIGVAMTSGFMLSGSEFHLYGLNAS